MSKTETISLKSQSAWLLFAKLIGFGFSFILPLITVRFIDQASVGIYRASFQIIINAVAILPLGFSMSAYYFLSRENERRKATILNIMLFNFVVGGLGCLTLFLYPQIFSDVLRSSELTAFAPLIGIIIWLWIFSAFLEFVAIANGEARMATVFIILAQFSKTLLMVSAVFFFASVESFLYAAMIQGVLQTLILLYYVNSRFPRFWLEFNRKFFIEQIFYALPFGLAGLLWIIQTDVHNYFVIYKFSPAEFAIYAYGCFQFPLIGMLEESIMSVLIPRMSQLQATDDKKEIIRLTTRAMQKLSFFYFPICVFLAITAQTFIITLFTVNYLESVPVFVINLALLPIGVLISDPILRAYKELGRQMLIFRILIVAGLISALYFGISHFDLRGMIAVAVVAVLFERVIAEILVMRKLEFKMRDFSLLENVWKTALISLLAGAITFLAYTETKEYLLNWGEHFAENVFHTTKLGVLNFVGGSLTLCVAAMVFAPIYLLGAYYWGIIEEEEIQQFKSIVNKVKSLFKKAPIHNPQSQTQN